MFDAPANLVSSNVKVLLATGVLETFTKVELTLPQIVSIENGLRIEKHGTPEGTITGQGVLLYRMLMPLVVAGGSWQKIKTMPLLTMTCEANDTDKSPLPLSTILASVLLQPPASIAFDRLEGSQDSFEFPFQVQGQVLLNGLPFFAHMDKPGL